jgi:hypothetical protein
LLKFFSRLVLQLLAVLPIFLQLPLQYPADLASSCKCYTCHQSCTAAVPIYKSRCHYQSMRQGTPLLKIRKIRQLCGPAVQGLLAEQDAAKARVAEEYGRDSLDMPCILCWTVEGKLYLGPMEWFALPLLPQGAAIGPLTCWTRM